MSKLYWKSRYGKGSATDYLNAPMTKEQYEAFVEALERYHHFYGDSLKVDLGPSGAAPGLEQTSGRRPLARSHAPRPYLNERASVPAAQATPSFFCRLVDDVVYWKVSFLSG